MQRGGNGVWSGSRRTDLLGPRRRAGADGSRAECNRIWERYQQPLALPGLERQTGMGMASQAAQRVGRRSLFAPLANTAARGGREPCSAGAAGDA